LKPENTLPLLLPTQGSELEGRLELMGKATMLTLGDHVGLGDHVVEEGQHLDHLLVLLSVSVLARAEGLRDVSFEELGVERVDNLQGCVSVIGRGSRL